MSVEQAIDQRKANQRHVEMIARDIEHGLEMEEHHDGYDRSTVV